MHDLKTTVAGFARSSFLIVLLLTLKSIHLAAAADIKIIAQSQHSGPVESVCFPQMVDGF